jgi:hypothetical protein
MFSITAALRHCEERSDVAIYATSITIKVMADGLDCRASLAMTTVQKQKKASMTLAFRFQKVVSSISFAA